MLRVHNYSRDTMQQSRLCEMSLLSIEFQILETWPVESTIDEFASLHCLATIGTKGK